MIETRIVSNGRLQFLQSDFRHVVLKTAQPIWRFLRKSDRPVKSDAIFVFGSDRSAAADKAAKLYHDGYAPKIVVTGGTGGRFGLPEGIPEAEKLKDRLLRRGVRVTDVVLETKSKHTQQNILMGIESLRQSGVPFSSLILVSLPYQQLRQWATFEKFRLNPKSGLAGIDLCNCPADNTLDSIKDSELFRTETKRMLVEIDNIIKYRIPPDEFLIWINIPEDVMRAHHHLKRLLGI